MRFLQLFLAFCLLFPFVVASRSGASNGNRRRVSGGGVLGADDVLPWLPANHPFRNHPSFNPSLHSNDPHPSQITTKAEAPHWNYERNNDHEGPFGWYHLEPLCGGTAQTPIDFDTSSVVYDRHLAPLQFNWDLFANGALVHNGHALQFAPHPDDLLAANIRTLKGGALPASQYNLLQFHIHVTSEHRVNKGSYAMELHAVHQNNDPAQAVPTNPNELAVVAILFYETEADNPALDSFVEAAKHINVDAGALSAPLSIDLSALLPEDKTYWNYHGSLTTPNCRETVTWHVLRQGVPIGSRQLEEIIVGQGFADNYRPIQAVNGRTIRTNARPPQPPVANCPPTRGEETQHPARGGGAAVNVNFQGMFNGFRLGA